MSPSSSLSSLLPHYLACGWTKRAAIAVLISERLADRRNSEGKGNSSARRMREIIQRKRMTYSDLRKQVALPPIMRLSIPSNYKGSLD